MAHLALVAAALLAGTALFLLLPGDGLSAPAVAARLGRAALRLVRRLVAAVARSRAIDALLEVPAASALAGRLASSDALAQVAGDEREAAATLAVGCLVVSAAAGVLFASPVAAVAALGGAIAAAVGYEASARRGREREVAASMPGIYRTLSVVMGSGQTLAQAVEYVGAHERGPAAEVFSRMSLRLRCGMGTEEAVELLAGELGATGSDLLATALVISHRTGGPLKELLLRSARLVERSEEFERLLSVKTAQVRLSVKIVCLMPALLVGLLALISPDFQEGLLTPAGMGCVLVAAALDAAALAIIKKIVGEVL